MQTPLRTVGLSIVQPGLFDRLELEGPFAGKTDRTTKASKDRLFPPLPKRLENRKSCSEFFEGVFEKAKDLDSLDKFIAELKDLLEKDIIFKHFKGVYPDLNESITQSYRFLSKAYQARFKITKNPGDKKLAERYEVFQKTLSSIFFNSRGELRLRWEIKAELRKFACKVNVTTASNVWVMTSRGKGNYTKLGIYVAKETADKALLD